MGLLVAFIWGACLGDLLARTVAAAITTAIWAWGFIRGRVGRWTAAQGLGIALAQTAWWLVCIMVGQTLVWQWLPVRYTDSDAVVFLALVALRGLWMLLAVPAHIARMWRGATVPGHYEQALRRMQ